MLYIRQFFLIGFFGIGILSICLMNHSKSYIASFNKLRDKQGLLKIFNENRTKVTDDEDDCDFKIMLQKRTPGLEEEHISPLIIKVVRCNQMVAGFIAYYMKTATKGIIWVMAVDKLFRRKGYGKLLMKKAIKDLCERGAIVIGLFVLSNNIPALTMYKSFGFIEKDIEDKNDTDTYLEYISKKA